jgi:hypothetical protein
MLSSSSSLSALAPSESLVLAPDVFWTKDHVTAFTAGMQRKRSDFPSVRFFTSKEFSNSKGGSDLELPSLDDDDMAAEARNSRLAFLEDEDGTLVGLDTLSAIRKTAEGLSWTIANYFGSKAPVNCSSWSLETRSYFVVELGRAFPCINMCSRHWKALRVASNVYTEVIRKLRNRGIVAPAPPNNKKGVVRGSNAARSSRKGKARAVTEGML